MQLIKTPLSSQIDPVINSLPGNMICFSHLRWDFVFQRPQHLLTRLAKSINIFYLEEPVFTDVKFPHYTYTVRGPQLTIITAQLPVGMTEKYVEEMQIQLFDAFMEERALNDYGFWYYTPMALKFSRKYSPELTVFDCMDELSAFKFAPESIKTLERELLQKADIVFTGGDSLYEAKKNQHTNIHAFPSSIEKSHFVKARTFKTAQADQVSTDRIKLGFYGVIDERFDIELIRGIATLKPDWDIVLIGPIVKIDQADLPFFPNIHYLGAKTYNELPKYVADWDIALIPFLLNESTRYISPTKTPEYLAAGLPVISTPIKDVIKPYGKKGLVSIGHSAEDFVHLAEKELHRTDRKEWLQKVDFFLANNSWDQTCNDMIILMNQAAKISKMTFKAIAGNHI